jgi:hypothetical protein
MTQADYDIIIQGGTVVHAQGTDRIERWSRQFGPVGKVDRMTRAHASKTEPMRMAA